MTESSRWDDLPERDRAMIVQGTTRHLQTTVMMLNQSALSTLGAAIEEQNPKLAAIFKEAGAFGDRMKLLLEELDRHDC